MHEKPKQKKLLLFDVVCSISESHKSAMYIQCIDE